MRLEPAGPWPSSRIVLDVPAHRDFVASIRAATRAAAVLSDLALEDAQELQMAVDEAAALLLPLAEPDDARAVLRAVFSVERGELAVTVSIGAEPGRSIDTAALAWVMLSALDPEVTVTSEAESGLVTIGTRRISRATTS